MLVVLDTLSPAERVAYVLHDAFRVPFDDIATVVARTPSAAGMLASRARRRVDERTRVARPEPVRHRTAVEAFLAAARDGDFERLLTLLDPDVVARAHRLVPGVPATRTRAA